MRVVLTLLILAVTVYGIVDCAQADARTRRNLPLWVWVLLMVALPAIGAVLWLVLSRMVAPPPASYRTRPVAPDDDPEFLRELERRARREQPGPIEDDPVEDDPQPPEADSGSDRPAGERG